MLIYTGASAWRKNEYLEVEIMECNDRPGMKLPAVVVHHSEKGTGVVFDAVSDEQQRILRAWLYDSIPASKVGSQSLAVA
jgi:hypothetical protein